MSMGELYFFYHLCKVDYVEWRIRGKQKQFARGGGNVRLLLVSSQLVYGSAQLVATVVGSTKLLYAGPG